MLLALLCDQVQEFCLPALQSYPDENTYQSHALGTHAKLPVQRRLAGLRSTVSPDRQIGRETGDINGTRYRMTLSICAKQKPLMKLTTTRLLNLAGSHIGK